MSCKDCKNKYEGCHSNCESYKAFAEEKRKEREWLRNQSGTIHFNDFVGTAKSRHKKTKEKITFLSFIYFLSL